MLAKLFAFFCSSPILRKFLWGKWYDFLAGFKLKRDWRFMNYGYQEVTVGARHAVPLQEPILDPEDEEDRYCIQLYHHVIGKTDLSGKTVVEVGSGRGGGCSYVQRYFKPAQMIGVDYSDKVVELCSKQYQAPGLRFQQGDAENLPFPDGDVDALLNVESSHCYGNLSKFFSEVYRVLKPGGYFLYADFRDKEKVEAWMADLKLSGLELLEKRDITSNVLAALDADNERKLKLIQESIPKFLVKPFLDFAGMKGAAVYELFRKREMLYFSFVLRK
jgi:ubiquinone/menaquinone biosynthesis C-methylase UbiE